MIHSNLPQPKTFIFDLNHVFSFVKDLDSAHFQSLLLKKFKPGNFLFAYFMFRGNEIFYNQSKEDYNLTEFNEFSILLYKVPGHIFEEFGTDFGEGFVWDPGTWALVLTDEERRDLDNFNAHPAKKNRLAQSYLESKNISVADRLFQLRFNENWKWEVYTRLVKLANQFGIDYTINFNRP